MANVLFKRGLQGSLPTGANIADGTFYLTTDTQRLFVGNGTGSSAKLIPLCETVQIVNNFDALPSGANIIEGQFYYTIAENVLCIYKTGTDGKKGWQQINPDTLITSVTTAGSGSTLTATLEDNKGDTHVADFEFEGVNVTVAASTTTGADAHAKLTITGDEDTLKVAPGANGANEATVTLDSTLSADSSVKIAGGSGIKITGAAGTNNNGTITIAADGLGLNDNDIKAINHTFNSNGAFITSLTTNANDNIDSSDQFIPKIKIGKTESEVTFANGVADLNVYTIAEIDGLIDTQLKTLNALTYKGTIGSNTGVVSPDVPKSNVRIGDVYLINGNLPASSTVDAKHGDLVIANGTEDASTGVISGAITWTVVPSGDEIDTTYAFTYEGNEVQLYNNITTNVDGTFSINAASGSPLQVTSTDGAFSIAHTTPTGWKAANSTGKIEGAAVNNDRSVFHTTNFKAVTGITRDSYGHVSDFVLTDVTIKDTHIDSTVTSATTAAADNVATVTVNTVAYDPSGSEIAAEAGSFKVTSATMEVTRDNSGAVVMNQVWGTF